MSNLAHDGFVFFMRHFPITKGKARLLSALWEPLSFGDYYRTVKLRQANVRMKVDIRRWIQRNIYFYGGYEQANCAQWIRLARRAHIIFDVGANVGIYSLLAASVNPRATVHAFEPTTEVYNALVENVRLNNLRNVLTHKMAVGARPGTLYLHANSGENGQNEGANFVSNAPLSPADEAVHVTSLDEYCSAQRLAHIDLLKMDIEGGEYDALLGARSLLARGAIRCLIMELSEENAQRSGHWADELVALLRDARYRVYELKTGRMQPLDNLGARATTCFALPPSIRPS